MNYNSGHIWQAMHGVQFGINYLWGRLFELRISLEYQASLCKRWKVILYLSAYRNLTQPCCELTEIIFYVTDITWNFTITVRWKYFLPNAKIYLYFIFKFTYILLYFQKICSTNCMTLFRFMQEQFSFATCACKRVEKNV